MAKNANVTSPQQQLMDLLQMVAMRKVGFLNPIFLNN
jgi:hypothetical protein